MTGDGGHDDADGDVGVSGNGNGSIAGAAVIYGGGSDKNGCKHGEMEAALGNGGGGGGDVGTHGSNVGSDGLDACDGCGASDEGGDRDGDGGDDAGDEVVAVMSGDDGAWSNRGG